MLNQKKYTLVILLLCSTILLSQAKNETALSSSKNLTLEDCIEIALKNNRFIPIAEYDTKIAEAKYNQAKSVYWPKVDLTSAYSILDDDPSIQYPPAQLQLDAMSIGPFNFQPPPIEIPVQNVKLADNKGLLTTVELMYPLFTGGKISSIIDQAIANKKFTKHSKRKTDLQVIYDTKKMYYSTILSKKLYEIGKEALERLEVTLELSERLYMDGSGNVTKIDYLKNKTVVESVRSILSRLKDNLGIAESALKFTLGIDWTSEITLVNSDLSFSPKEYNLADLLFRAAEHNPQLAQIKEGLNIYRAKVEEAESEYYPNLAIMGSYVNIVNSYDFGIVTPQNKNTWMIGLGLKLPVFNGFKTANKIDEAEYALKQMEAKQGLLSNGIILQIRKLHYNLAGAVERESSSRTAMETAIENRDLSERAYKNDLVELDELIQAQIIESFMKAQYQISLFEYADLKAQLENILGVKNYD